MGSEKVLENFSRGPWKSWKSPGFFFQWKGENPVTIMLSTSEAVTISCLSVGLCICGCTHKLVKMSLGLTHSACSQDILACCDVMLKVQKSVVTGCLLSDCFYDELCLRCDLCAVRPSVSQWRALLRTRTKMSTAPRWLMTATRRNGVGLRRRRVRQAAIQSQLQRWRLRRRCRHHAAISVDNCLTTRTCVCFLATIATQWVLAFELLTALSCRIK